MASQEQHPVSAAAKSGGPPRKWLMDRVSGQSKYNDRERPPGPCCWVPPCVGSFPGLLETNILCRCFGKCGISGSELFRFVCLHLGFVANILAMIATSYAAFSISLEYFLLSKASMEVLEARDLTGNMSTEVVTIFLGLRGVAFDDPAMATSPLGQQMVFGYDDLCDVAEYNGNMYVDISKDCASCAGDYFSMNAVISLLISVTLFFPTFFSQQLRMYSGYDVNCVKNLLTVVGFCTILLNLNVMVTYFYLCSKESFYEDETVFFDQQGNPFVSEEDSFFVMEYKWKWGWGLIALIAGTGLKLIDVLCNIAVPTPSVTRDAKEQEIYETIVFGVDPKDDDSVDDVYL